VELLFLLKILNNCSIGLVVLKVGGFHLGQDIISGVVFVVKNFLREVVFLGKNRHKDFLKMNPHTYIFTYILDEDGNPIPEKDPLKWADWFETTNRTVKKTQVGKLLVSTVFLGLNHAFDGGIPLLYETMVFDEKGKAVIFDELDAFEIKMVKMFGFVLGPWKRYATRTGAEEEHDQIVRRLRAMRK